jgi:hypothetical protein
MSRNRAAAKLRSATGQARRDFFQWHRDGTGKRQAHCRLSPFAWCRGDLPETTVALHRRPHVRGSGNWCNAPRLTTLASTRVS